MALGPPGLWAPSHLKARENPTNKHGLSTNYLPGTVLDSMSLRLNDLPWGDEVNIRRREISEAGPSVSGE